MNDNNRKGDTTMETTIEKVRAYVRAHRNRELMRTRNGTEARSKPLSLIAEELDVRPGDVREAMRACGWFQAITDAEQAEARGTVEGKAACGSPQLARKHSRKQPKFNPHGWTE